MSDPCETCQGTGQYLGHAPSCDDDLCALNGDQFSCSGVMHPCTCPAGLPYRLTLDELARARWNQAGELRLAPRDGRDLLATLDTSHPWNYKATLYDGRVAQGWPMDPVQRLARRAIREAIQERDRKAFAQVAMEGAINE